MSASKAKSTPKTTTGSVDGEMVSLLRMDVPRPKVNYLRERTEAALKLKADRRAAYIADQIKVFYATMEPIADKGLHEADYCKDLCPEAQKQLREEGIKIVDHGENICSSFKVSW